MSRVQDERACFCKLILQKEPMQRLKIPPKFSRLYSKELPNEVILKGPSGENWDAKLCKDSTGVYIYDGWREFHIDNSLGNKEFLIVEYDGKRTFEVQIFDPTGLKRVNVPVTKSKETNVHNEKRPRGRPRKRHGKHNPEVESNKLGKIKEGEEETDLPVVGMSSQPCKQRRIKAGKLTAGFPVSKSIFTNRSLEKNVSKSEVNARLRAVEEMFTSKFPYFTTYTKIYSVKMYIPVAFARVHLPWKRANIVLRNHKGKTWEVVCVESKEWHFFSGGWSTFVRDNMLGAGDVCVFELLTKKEFLVTVFRSPETSTA